MELRRVRPIDEAGEALREARKGAVEGPKRLEAVQRLVEQRVDWRLRRRVDAFEVAREHDAPSAAGRLLVVYVTRQGGGPWDGSSGGAAGATTTATLHPIHKVDPNAD